MNCQHDIESLAENKLNEADCLFKNGFYDGSYYLAGYVVELLLKARVCKTLGIDNFFNFKGKKEMYRPFKVHNLEELILLSGVYTEFSDLINNNSKYKADWSILCQWNEESRYLTGKSEKEVKDFIILVREFKKWIQKHL